VKNKKKEYSTMRIAIPVAEGKLAQHFGHCESFAIIDVNESGKEIIQKTSVKPPAHEPGVLPRWLHEQKVNVIIAGGMGQRAQQLFQDNEIKVVVGASAVSPDEIVNAYLNNNLESGVNLCDH
jgi:predicted Fe-Mo cluster-binding NifX family protein